MKVFSLKPRRILTVITVSTILMTGFMLSARAEQQDHSQQIQQNWAQHRQNWIKARLVKMAERLEIKSSQQGAWQTFAKAVEEPLNAPMKKPDANNADAAEMARRNADFATAYAKKMVQIADATAKLQEVLTPDQRITLDQMAHEFHHHRHHEHHEEHEDGEHQRHHDND
ncbi:MAG TPA: Spy/CpxP family protein refolding chaperone [Burkholderiaceae bacterium]